MKKALLFCFCCWSSMVFAQAEKIKSEPQLLSERTKVILQEGTLITASLNNEIRGGNMSVGDQVEFSLAQPIAVDGQVVVREGLKIMGTVSEARASGVIGRKGKLAVNIEYLYLSDGQVINLKGQSATNLKGSGAAAVATAVVFTPFALLIPGKGAKFKSGTIFHAYIAKDTELRQ